MIKVAFVDFWEACDIENHIISKVLKKNFDVRYVDPQEADYIFFSVFGDAHWFLPDDAIKIFYTGENLSPDFNICDYAIGFDWIEFGDRYFRLPNYYATNFFYPKVNIMQHKHELTDNIDYANRGFCSFVVSNGEGNPMRRKIFETLSKYKQVDSGGRWMNNVGGPVLDKLEFERKHKFSICFENSSHIGYTTEKIVEAFAAQTVPIYWGDPYVTKVFNKDSFINVMDYKCLDDLIDTIVEIDKDKDFYIKMLKTPALIDSNFSYDAQVDYLSAFLCNIVTQPKDSAKRYNRDFWGKKAIENQRAIINESRKGVIAKVRDRLNFLIK